VLRIQALCDDARDPLASARFRREVLGWRITIEEHDEVVLGPRADSPQDAVAADVIFLEVPEEKASKNRLHLELRPDDQATEPARLEVLGAQRVSVGQGTT